MKITRNFIYCSLLFFLFFVVGILNYQSVSVFQQVEKVVAASKSYGPFEGHVAIPFSLRTLEGDTVSLEDYRGKKVIVNFFASWCPPCQDEMPLLVDFVNRMDKEKMQFIAINLTSQEKNNKDVQLFMDHYRADFTTVLDTDGDLMKQYQIIGIPTTLIIDEDGIIEKRINGMLTADLVAKLLQHE